MRDRNADFWFRHRESYDESVSINKNLNLDQIFFFRRFRRISNPNMSRASSILRNLALVRSCSIMNHAATAAQSMRPIAARESLHQVHLSLRSLATAALHGSVTALVLSLL